MAPRGKVGSAFVFVGLKLDEFRRAITGQLPREAAAGGQKAGAELLKAMQQEFKGKAAQTREALAKNWITKEEARRLGADAAKEFNKSIIAELDRMRKAGQQNTAEFTKLQASLKNVARAGREAGDEGAKGFGRFGASVKAAFGVLAAFVSARAIFGFFRSSVREAAEASEVWTRLGSAVENAGVRFEAARPQIEALTKDLQARTRFGDEQTAEALSELVTLTGDYGKSLANLDLVLDLAIAKKIDLRTAAQLVGRALIGETSTLRRYGIIVREGADAIQVMRDVSRGFAEKDGQSFVGQLHRVRNAWADIKEAVGEAVIGTTFAGGKFNDLAEALQGLEGWIKRNEGALQNLIGFLADATAKAGGFIAAIGHAIDPAGDLLVNLRKEILAGPSAQDPNFLRAGLLGRNAQRQSLEARKAELEKRFAFENERAAAEGREVNAVLVKQLRDVGNELKINIGMAKFFADQLAKIGAAPPPTGGGGDPMTPEELAKRAAATERLTKAQAAYNEQRAITERLGFVPADVATTLQQIAKLAEEIAQIEKDSVLLGAAAPEGTADLIARKRADLEALSKTVEPTVARLQSLFAVVDGALPPLVGQVTQLGDSITRLLSRFSEGLPTSFAAFVDAVKEAQAEVLRAQLAGDKQAEESAKRTLKARQDALRRAAREIAQGLEDSTLPAAQIEDILDRINDALQAGGVNTEGVKAGFNEAAQSIEVVLRGVLSAGDAMGVFSNETRRALTGFIDLVQAAAQLKTATTTLGKLSGAAGIAGAAIGIGAALFGGGGAEKAERERQAREIAEMTDNLRRLNDVLGPLTQAVERAEDALLAIAERAGVSGLGSREDVVRTRDAIAQQIKDIQAGRTDVPAGLRGTVLSDLQTKLDALNDALKADADAFEKLIENKRKELAERERDITLTTRAAEAAKFAADQAAELADALDASLPEDVIAEIRRVQELERAAREEQLALAERRAIEDAQVAKLEAEGKTQLAAVTRLLLEQERRLADLRKEGASAAEIAAEEELQRAQGEQFARDLETGLLMRAAERSGDPEAIRRVQEAGLAREFADTQSALEKLRDEGLISAERFAELSDLLRDDFAAALEEAAEAAEEAAEAMREAADDFELGLAGDIAGLTPGEEDDRAVARQRAEDEAEARRKEAEKLFGKDPEKLQKVLGQIDKWLQLTLDAIEGDAPAGVAAAGGATAGETEVTRSVTAISETTAQGMTGLLREQRDIQRDMRDLLRQYNARAGIGVTSSSLMAGSTNVRVQFGDLHLPNVTGSLSTVGDARRTASAFSRTAAAALSPEILRAIDIGIERRFRAALRANGDAKV